MAVGVFSIGPFVRIPRLSLRDGLCMFWLQVGFKKTKRRIKKIRKKEKVSDDLRLDDTRNTDFGSRFLLCSLCVFGTLQF